MAHRATEGAPGSKKGYRKICTCILTQDTDDDDVVMHEADCSFLSEHSFSETEDDSLFGCIAVQLPPPAHKSQSLESRIVEIRRKNIEWLERFQEVEEDRRWAEQNGATLPHNSVTLVQTVRSSPKKRAPQQLRSEIIPQPCIYAKSNQLKRITVTFTNEVPQESKRTVVTKSKGGRRHSKSWRIEYGLKEACDVTVEGKEQLGMCTISNNNKEAMGCSTDLSESTSDAARRDYLHWKKRNNRSQLGDLAEVLRSSRERRMSAW